MDTKTYMTTDRAGWCVAGTFVPPDGDPSAPRPKIGHELVLTDAQAEYELAQGTIVLKPDNPAKKLPVSQPPAGT